MSSTFLSLKRSKKSKPNNDRELLIGFETVVDREKRGGKEGGKNGLLAREIRKENNRFATHTLTF